MPSELILQAVRNESEAHRAHLRDPDDYDAWCAWRASARELRRIAARSPGDAVAATEANVWLLAAVSIGFFSVGLLAVLALAGGAS